MIVRPGQFVWPRKVLYFYINLQIANDDDNNYTVARAELNGRAEQERSGWLLEDK